MTLKTALIVVICVLVSAIAAGVVWAWTPDRPRDQLEAQYLHSAGDLMDVAGTVLHVRDSGPVSSGVVIIMLHGVGSHLQTWDGWSNALRAEARIIALDLPGAGLSHPDPTGNYSDERTIGILNALMDDLDIRQAVIIGNSLGGRIAWTFAALHPDRVSGLVLVSPDGFASPGFEYGKPVDVPAIMSLMTVALPQSMLRQNLEIAYSDPSRLTQPVMDRYHALMLAPGNRQALLDRMRQTILAPPVPLLAQITAPVLLVWGEDDRMIPIANAQDYLIALPNAQLVVLPSLGHVPHEEAPLISVVPVITFLNVLSN